MSGRLMSPSIARWLSGLLASVLMVAAASGLDALLKPWVSPLLAIYVLAIMPVAVLWGTGLAVFCLLFIPWSFACVVCRRILFIRAIDRTVTILVIVLLVLMMLRWLWGASLLRLRRRCRWGLRTRSRWRRGC